MKIKPTWSQTYLVRYMRGKESQYTELVDTDEGEVHRLIASTFRGCFTSPREENAPFTKIQVLVIDNVERRNRISFFTHTKNGEQRVHPYAFIKNKSPREIRIEFEKAIREQS